MADTVDKATRSRMMAGIRGKDTKPEKAIRSALHSAGFRYRVHVAGLPGKPDIVFPKYKAVIFVHGCFWHRHADCWWSTTPSSNAVFWAEKFAQNVARDNRNIVDLKKMGWRVATVWEGRSGGSHRAVAYRKQAKSHFAEARQFEEIASKIA